MRDDGVLPEHATHAVESPDFDGYVFRQDSFVHCPDLTCGQQRTRPLVDSNSPPLFSYRMVLKPRAKVSDLPPCNWTHNFLAQPKELN